MRQNFKLKETIIRSNPEMYMHKQSSVSFTLFSSFSAKDLEIMCLHFVEERSNPGLFWINETREAKW